MACMRLKIFFETNKCNMQFTCATLFSWWIQQQTQHPHLDTDKISAFASVIHRVLIQYTRRPFHNPQAKITRNYHHVALIVLTHQANYRPTQTRVLRSTVKCTIGRASSSRTAASGIQYLLMPNILTPWNIGSFASSVTINETALKIKCIWSNFE